MSNSKPQADKNLVKVFLQNARSSLLEDAASGVPVNEELTAAERLIEENQFELALNRLANIGRKATPGAKFWDSLSNAARELGLRKEAGEFQFLWAESASLSLKRVTNRK